jgi:hypothetical protein
VENFKEFILPERYWIGAAPKTVKDGRKGVMKRLVDWEGRLTRMGLSMDAGVSNRLEYGHNMDKFAPFETILRVPVRGSHANGHKLCCVKELTRRAA